jgi:pectate lyase
LAFPGAEGFGALAKGGRGGDVYHVTNLNASGAGSFGNGITTAPATGRTIVFDVSGYSTISGILRVTNPLLTIAGQTAPGDGFAVKDGTFWVSAGDVIVRHFRFRDGYSADSVDMDSKAVNFIWDHTDMMFSHDENMSSFGTPPENMTYQYSINAWGLETHSCGGLWDQGKVTAHHTYWAHNHTRNPKVRATLLDWVNNVTFDWDIGFIMGDSSTPARWQANVRGSYFVSGTSKTNALESANLDSNGNPNFHLFMEDCALDGNINGVLDVTKTDFDMASGSYEKMTAPFPLTVDFKPVSASNPVVGVPVTQDDHLTAYKKVISSVGPLRLDVKYAKPLRDEVDALVVEDLVKQNHRHLNYQQIDANGLANGGYGTLASTPAPADTDKDGMPDYWEKAVGLNSSQDDHNGLVPCVYAYVPGNVGYTWLEDYLQWLAIPHGVVAKRTATTDTSLDVDMVRFTSGLKAGATYTVSAAVNGTVTVAADGKTAHFVPNVNFVGRAGFKFSGTDSDKSTIGFDVGVLVGETAATN